MVWKVPMTSAIGKPLVPSSTGIPFMFRHRHMDPLRGSREGAFTLIEIVVALTIIAIIAALREPRPELGEVHFAQVRGDDDQSTQHEEPEQRLA